MSKWIMRILGGGLIAYALFGFFRTASTLPIYFSENGTKETTAIVENLLAAENFGTGCFGDVVFDANGQQHRVRTYMPAEESQYGDIILKRSGTIRIRYNESNPKRLVTLKKDGTPYRKAIFMSLGGNLLLVLFGFGLISLSPDIGKKD